LADQATKLAADLKAPASTPGQPDAFQALQKLCQSQVALTTTLTDATAPSAGFALVKEVLSEFTQQSDAVAKIGQSAAAGGVAGCRDAALQLATLPPLPAEVIAQVKGAIARDIAAPVQRWRAVLIEALQLINDKADQDYFELDSWHNKLIWL